MEPKIKVNRILTSSLTVHNARLIISVLGISKIATTCNDLISSRKNKIVVEIRKRISKIGCPQIQQDEICATLAMG
jgi:hypothetical protein